MWTVLSLAAFAAVGSSTEMTEMERIEYINSVQSTWTAGISARKFEGGFKRLLGAVDNEEDMWRKIEAGEIQLIEEDPNMAVPTSFDSATNWPDCALTIGDIRDQSNCGCCWAFGTVSAASDRYCIATRDNSVVFSATDSCFCSNNLNGCNGGQLSTAYQHMSNQGVVTGGQQNQTGPITHLCSEFPLPHCHHHGPQGSDPYPDEGSPGCPSQTSPKCPKACDADAYAPHTNWAGDKYKFTGNINSYVTMTAIQQAIMAGGPIGTAFNVYSDFENYVSGIYQHTTGSYLGGHAVRFVGWGEENSVLYWKVANSWNPYWGEKGYFRILRGVNECNIERQGQAPANDVVWTDPYNRR
jgi:cathepsin B